MQIQSSDLLKNTPPYAFAEIDKLVAELKAEGVTPIDFGVGDPSSPTPDFINEAGRQAIIDYKSAGYPSYIGRQDFRQACAGYMKRNFGVSLDPETEISSTIGSKEAIFNFPLGFINPGDIVIIPTPGYPPMTTGTKYAYGEPFFVGLFEDNDFLIDYESIPESVADKAKIMWINYPNSPTAKTASLDYYKGLIAWAHKHNIILACDEGCYIDLYYQEKPHSILELYREGIITFYSLSKRSNMTGWRVGFVAGDPELVKAFKQIKTNIDSGTPNFIQAAAITALGDDDHVAALRQEYQVKRDIMLDVFNKLDFPPVKPEATFYLWQKAPSGMTGADLAKRLLEEKIGVVVTPGEFISREDSIRRANPGRDFVRFALVPTSEEVKEAARRIKENY